MNSCELTFGAKVLAFNASLEFTAKLPPGVGIMNPFRENECANAACAAFYRKYYNDYRERSLILGINPGRFGAGLTGVPFTDPKRLREKCHIHVVDCPAAHEPSSEFVYDVIDACDGPERFYEKWYINSLSPLGFTKIGKKGAPVNYNYYDNAQLMEIARPFIIKTLWEQIGLGIRRGACICLGTGKNAAFLEKLNQQEGFFSRIIPVEHPRFIIQYRKAALGHYIGRYKEAFAEVLGANNMDK